MYRCCASLFCLFLVVAPAHARTWRDITGKYRVEAEFVTMTENVVRLRRADGGVIDVPLAKLSRADQQRARALSESSLQSATSRSTDQPSKSDLLRALKMKATAHFVDGTYSVGGKQVPPPLEMVIDLSGKPAAEASAFGFLRVTKAEASGKALAPERTFLSSEDISDGYQKIKRGEDEFFADHPEDRVHVKMRFQNPGSTVKNVAAAGSFKLRTGGQQQVVVVKNVSTIRGPTNNAALKSVGLQLDLTPESGKLLTVAASGNQDLIDKIIVTDDLGREPASLTFCSDGTFNGKTYHSFEFEDRIPADTQLRIHLRTGAQEIDVPFEFGNIPISHGDGLVAR